MRVKWVSNQVNHVTVNRLKQLSKCSNHQIIWARASCACLRVLTHCAVLRTPPSGPLRKQTRPVWTARTFSWAEAQSHVFINEDFLQNIHKFCSMR